MPHNTALIFANGAVRDGATVQHTLNRASDAAVIAADGGARLAAEHFGLTPHVILGDLDSLNEQDLATFRQQGINIQQYPPDKDETDLELALKWAVNNGYNHLRIIGGLGRRVDQTFSNIYLLALPELADTDTRFVAGNQQIWMLQPGTHPLDGQPGDTLSLLPMQADVTGIQTQGLQYPLHNDTLYFGPARGVSNVLTQPRATVEFQTGILLVVHTQGRAE